MDYQQTSIAPSPTYTPVQQTWNPPSIPDQNDHTEPLFPSNPNHKPLSVVSEHTERVQNDGYHISIREISPEGERRYDIIVSAEISIGRSPTNNLQINSSTVSGVQCVFIAGPDTVFISNRSNANITQLNGVKLTDTRPLKSKDTLYLGKVQLTIMDIRKYAER